MTKKTLEQLQEQHSEMCATAADLGVKVPADLTIDFDSVEVGATVVSNLDALIRKFREGLDEGGDKKSLATEDKGSDTVPRKTSKKKSSSTAKTKSTEAKAAEAKPAEESAVAKKAKKTAKKATKKAASARKPNGFADDAKITWNAAKKNPAREGSGRYDRIEQVRKASGKTVKTFYAGKGNPTTLKNCVAAKLCTVG